MKIAPLRVADIPAVIEMGRAMHAASPEWRARRFSDQKVHELANRCLDDADWMALLAWSHTRPEPIGMFVGFVSEDWFGADRYAADLVFWVEPKARGSTAAMRLFFAFEKWADLRGATEMRVGVSTGIRVPQATAFYRKTGFADRGVLLSKRL